MSILDYAKQHLVELIMQVLKPRNGRRFRVHLEKLPPARLRQIEDNIYEKLKARSIKP